MISSVGQNNNVQRFSAVNAFRSNSKPLKAEEQNSLQDEQALSTTKVAPKSLLDRIDVADVRKCAEYVGEFDITDDERIDVAAKRIMNRFKPAFEELAK